MIAILSLILLTALIIVLMYFRVISQNWPNRDLIIEVMRSCLSGNRDG